MRLDKLKKLSFDEIQALFDYLTDGEELLEEVLLKKNSILIKTNKKVYLLELVKDNYGYGVLWEKQFDYYTEKNNIFSVESKFMFPSVLKYGII